MTSSWSPASWMSSTAQFTHASDPSMTGAPPVTAGCHNTPANLSTPEMANRRHTSCWWSASTLTQKLPALTIRGQVVDDLAGANATSGGSVSYTHLRAHETR